MLNQEKGFTILEGLISIAVLSITVIGMYSMMIFAQNSIVNSRRVTEATNYARKKLERIMDTEFTNIIYTYPNNKAYDANPFDDKTFDTDPDGDYTASLPNSSWKVEYFLPPSGIDPLTIRLTVSWKENGDNKPEHYVRLASRVTEGKI